MALIRRAEWGARRPKRVSNNISPSSATAHWGGPSPWRGHDFTDHGHCYSVVRSYQNFHMDGRGWSDIAYTGLPCPHGDVFEGRGPGVRSAANGTNSGNFNSYALCYIGGEGDPLTDAGKNAFLEGARWLGVPLNKVHGDWKATGCPGPEIIAWVRSGAPAPGGRPVPPPPPPPKPPVKPPEPTIPESIDLTGVDMYIAVEGVGFFAQVGNVTVPLPGLDLAGYANLTKNTTCGTMIIPGPAVQDWAAKTMKQTSLATGS